MTSLIKGSLQLDLVDTLNSEYIQEAPRNTINRTQRTSLSNRDSIKNPPATSKAHHCHKRARLPSYPENSQITTMTRFLLQLLLTVLLSDVCRADVNLRGIDKSQDKHVYRDGMPHLTTRSDIIKQTPLLPSHIHEVIFAVKQKNMDKLERILNDVSDPDSANYGQHMSGEQVGALTMNPEARDAIVNYLYANGASVTAESLNSEFITASAPISLWNKVFNTEFNLFHQRQVDGAILHKVRAESFSIPNELDEFVFGAINVIEMPVMRSRRANIVDPPKEVVTGASRVLAGTVYNGWILPKILRSYYNVSGNQGNSFSTQTAYSANDDYLNRVDVAKFQADDNMNQPVKEMNGHVVNDRASMKGGDWTEGNLDVQYMVAMSPGSPSSYWWWDNEVATFLASLQHVVEVPLVISFSYGGAELYTPKWEHDLFSQEGMKLSVRGVTILASSGDDGAPSFISRNDPSKCAYHPDFPAANPYVISVGGTQVRKQRTRI
jgi:tripeptidyl-peptidase I